MLNNHSKFNLKIFSLLTFFCLLIFIPSTKVFAELELEIEYPKTITGSTITGGSDLSQYLKYVFDAGLSIGLALVVLTLIISGIFSFIAPVSPKAMAMAKERFNGAISGLLILLLTYLIITTINPYLSIFRTSPLEQIEFQIPESARPGILFYKSKDCSSENAIYNQNIPDLNDLKNKINSVEILQDSSNNVYYISILYDNINYWGACQYINPNTGCQETNISASSASIYKYDFNPDGDGVYIYRKPHSSVAGKEENKNGGYLKIENSEIKTGPGKSLYFKKLSELSFSGEKRSGDCTVPKEEQDCAKWGDKGECEKYTCPSLSGENISSIKINGDYLVILMYRDDNDTGLISTYCQAFPTENDYNKIGPQQIKWDPINSSGYKPTHILIIPIKQK